eukprot:g946.t1
MIAYLTYHESCAIEDIVGGEAGWSKDIRIQRARRRIFGTHVGDNKRSGRKSVIRHYKNAESFNDILQRTPGGDKSADSLFKQRGYMNWGGGNFGLPRKLEKDYIREVSKARKRARGKGPPKKGEGGKKKK